MQSGNLLGPATSRLLPFRKRDFTGFKKSDQKEEFLKRLLKSSFSTTFNLNMTNNFTIGVPQVWLYLGNY